MFKIPKQEYTTEFRELAVKRVQGGEGIAKVARERNFPKGVIASFRKFQQPVSPSPEGIRKHRAATAAHNKNGDPEMGDVLETLKKLPNVAYVSLPGSGATIAIKRGEMGYYTIHSRLTADELNRLCGVTKTQAEAMLVGSVFGWHVPGANPDRYDENGTPIKYH